MRIRIPIHPAFLEEGTDITGTEEKVTKKVTKKMKQYSLILNFMEDGEWHKTSEITEILGLKDTRTKELLKEFQISNLNKPHYINMGLIYDEVVNNL